LMTSAESESVQLHAARAVLKDLLTVRAQVNFEERIVKIESRLQGGSTRVP
jgi:hypothetical protein